MQGRKLLLQSRAPLCFSWMGGGGYSEILFAAVNPANRVQSQISSETISRVGGCTIRSRWHDKSNGYGNLVR